MFNPVSFTLLLLVGMLVGFLFVVFSFKYPYLAISLVLITFIINSFLGDSFLAVQVGDFSIRLLDALSIALIAIGTVRLIYQKRAHRLLVFSLVLFGGLILISLFRGIAGFGIQKAVNSSRVYLYFFSTLLFSATITNIPFVTKRIVYWWGLTAWFLLSLVIIRWILVALGYLNSIDYMAAGGLQTRVVDAFATFFLFQALVFSWYAKTNDWYIPLGKYLPYLLIIAIIILQHRTVWVILILSFIMISVLDRRTPRYVWITIGVVLVLGIIAGLLLWNSPFFTSLASSAQNSQTFEWRVAGWKILLSPDRFQHTIDYLIGQPFGTGYARIVNGFPADVNPHNFYIQTFLSVGGLGLVLLLFLYLMNLWLLYRHKKYPLSRILFSLLMAQALFYITYPPSYEQGILLGFAIAFNRIVSENENSYDQSGGFINRAQSQG